MSNYQRQAHNVIVLTPRAVATYHWIEDFCKREGRFPKYREIGEYINSTKGNGSTNYYTKRNNGIRTFKQLERRGFVKREGKVLSLTGKPLNAETIARNSRAD